MTKEKKKSIGIKTIIRFIISLPLIILIPLFWVFSNGTLKDIYYGWFDIIDERTDSSIVKI